MSKYNLNSFSKLKFKIGIFLKNCYANLRLNLHNIAVFYKILYSIICKYCGLRLQTHCLRRLEAKNPDYKFPNLYCQKVSRKKTWSPSRSSMF